MASQVSKLNYVDSKLGAPTSGQQTTRVLFNTIKNPTGNSLSFFKVFQGLTQGQTNLTQNKLDSSESMVIKSIWLGAFLELDNTLQQFTGIPNTSATLSIVVGNQTVVKELPIQFNSVAGESFDRLHAINGVVTNPNAPIGYSVQPTEIRLLTDIVIPPQTSFEVKVEGSNQFFLDTYVCALSGYGKIFSAGASF